MKFTVKLPAAPTTRDELLAQAAAMGIELAGEWICPCCRGAAYLSASMETAWSLVADLAEPFVVCGVGPWGFTCGTAQKASLRPPLDTLSFLREQAALEPQEAAEAG